MVGGLPTSNCLLRKLCWRLTLLRTYTILHVVLFSWLGNHGFALHVLLRKVLKLQCLRHVSKISRSVMISWGATIIVAIGGSKKPWMDHFSIQTLFHISGCLTSTNPQDRPEKALEAAKVGARSPKLARDTLRDTKVILHFMAYDGRWWPMMAYDGLCLCLELGKSGWMLNAGRLGVCEILLGIVTGCWSAGQDLRKSGMLQLLHASPQFQIVNGDICHAGWAKDFLMPFSSIFNPSPHLTI